MILNEESVISNFIGLNSLETYCSSPNLECIDEYL